MRLLPLFLLTVALTACAHKDLVKKTNTVKSPDKGDVISAPIVKKAFVKKNGEVTDYEEYYIQRSIKDYFIKFCESNVTREEFEQRLNASDALIQTLKMKVEFISDGAWDQCDEEYEVQSRMGDYVIILEII